MHPRRLGLRINCSLFFLSLFFFEKSALSFVHRRSAAFGTCARTRRLSKHASCVLLSPRACACVLCAVCLRVSSREGLVYFFFARFGRDGSATNVAWRGNPPAPFTSPRSAGRRSSSSALRRPSASTRSAGIGAGGCTFAQRLCSPSAASAGAQKAANGSRRNLCRSEPGTLRGELGRSSARFSRDRAGKTPPAPQIEAAITEGKDFVLLCCVFFVW